MSLHVEYHISPIDSDSPSKSVSSSARSRSWFSRWLAPIALFLIGCFALGYYGYAILDARWFQSDQSRQFDQQLDQARNDPHAVAVAELTNEAAAELKARGKLPAPTLPSFDKSTDASLPPPAPGSRLGRIEIPSLNMKIMIQEGTDYRTLQRGIGHITGTASLGQSGNVGLAGHRDTFFRDLRNIHKGDEITLVTLTGDTHYRVDQISIVGPRDSGVLRDSGENVLTLVTCYPFYYVGNAPKRFIVRAIQINSSSESASPKSGALHSPSAPTSALGAPSFAERVSSLPTGCAPLQPCGAQKRVGFVNFSFVHCAGLADRNNFLSGPFHDSSL
jgi:LPXTG-site transpeptidase (sortase) family protein